MEVSGRIAAVGDGVTEWQVGDEVCALLAGGGYAERVAVSADHVLPVPAGVDLVDAAGLPEVACTVWSNLVRVAHMSHWQTLLVHGGGSGIGTFAIQYASALGVRVFTTARLAKHDVLRALGADVTIDYTTQDFVAEAKAATHNRGVDLILDIQGAAYLNRNIDALADGGHLVIIGLQGGRTGEIDLGAMLSKRANLSATTLRTRTAADKASIIAGIRKDVWPLIEAKKIVPVTDRTVPMAQSAKAHEVMAASDHIGKILLVTHGDSEIGPGLVSGVAAVPSPGSIGSVEPPAQEHAEAAGPEADQGAEATTPGPEADEPSTEYSADPQTDGPAPTGAPAAPPETTLEAAHPAAVREPPYGAGTAETAAPSAPASDRTQATEARASTPPLGGQAGSELYHGPAEPRQTPAPSQHSGTGVHAAVITNAEGSAADTDV
jgi:putative PIG3 family NAD(P)H quinone oxidoreductase